MSISTFPDGSLLDVNDRWCESRGFSREEVIRKKALQLKIWKNIEERTQWAEDIHEKGSSNRECNFLKKNGEEWIRIMLSQLSILNEEKVVFNSVIDITEQRRVEKNLSQTQKQIQDIIDGTPNIVFVKDLEGRFVTVNRQFEQMLGTTSDQLRGKTDYDIFSKERAGYYREHDRGNKSTDRSR